MLRPPPRSPLFPYTTLFRSADARVAEGARHSRVELQGGASARKADGRGACRRRCGEQCRQRGERKEQGASRSEEHTSELQSRQYIVCRLLLEKKKETAINIT